MTAPSFADECADLSLTLLRLKVGLLELRRDLAKRQVGGVGTKYRADQPRVPAGNADGGQWTDGSGSASGPMSFQEWLAGGWAQGLGAVDADAGEGAGLGDWNLPDDEPRIEEVNGRGRGGGGVWPGATPGQQARLTATDVQAQAAIRRVQEIDPRWRPPASMSEGIEGAILSNQAAVRQAQARLQELQGKGIGPGPFASESIPLRGSGRANAREQADIDRIGRLFGCHTCGTTDPGNSRGHFILDHQPSNALNFFGREQRGYPHCSHCSSSQGGHIHNLLRRR